MKKILCILLTLVMLTGTLCIGVAASGGTGEPTVQRIVIGENDTTVTHGGVTYSVIRTAAQFKAMKNGNNYILANDIDFGGETLTGSVLFDSISVTLEGNYYSVLNYIGGSTFKGMFTSFSTATVVIRNLTVGSEAAPIVMNFSGDNGGAGVIAAYLGTQGSVLRCENVHVYTNLTATKFCIGGFVGKMSGNSTIELTDCSLSGFRLRSDKSIG